MEKTVAVKVKIFKICSHSGLINLEILPNDTIFFYKYKIKFILKILNFFFCV